MPRLSVIIPTHNSRDTLEACLSAVRKSHFKDYELIIADCASRDSTVLIARQYTDKILKLHQSCGRNYARRAGAQAAAADIIVNIDSDILVSPDTLAKISDYLLEHNEVDAVTGLLSKVHPHNDFFSQYKNLYMHYRFARLPHQVTFLYGSMYAFRGPLAALYDWEINIADDTAFGRNLFCHGKKIAFLKDLEVVHLKKYTFFSLLKNDFRITSEWAKIFFKYRAWRLLGKEKGFAHASGGQILGLATALITACLALLCLGGYVPIISVWLSLSVWLLLQARFFFFLAKEKGPAFIVPAFFITFLSDLIKVAGIAGGIISFFLRKSRK